PVNAVQIRNGQASILYSRCITCGKCVKSCPQHAMVAIDSKDKVRDLLKNSRKVIAVLDPSFVVSFYPYTYSKIAGALNMLGFWKIWEAARGAYELSSRVAEFIKKNNSKTYMSSACPAFVSMIEKHYPELTGNLLPFVSPMIATGRIIRQKYRESDVSIIFIGPCVAKKAEAEDPQFEGIIDCVLTFDELKGLFLENKIEIEDAAESEFDSGYCGRGRLFSLQASWLQLFKSGNLINEDECIYVSSDRECLKLIDSVSKGRISARFADSMICSGCIEGPRIDSKLSHYERVDRIHEYFENCSESEIDAGIQADLSRSFRNRRRILPYPSEEDIKKVLQQTNKFKKEDELNCGACGYNTCREKAIAVVQGIAEVEMCLPYLLSKKTMLFEQLSQKYREISILKDELETIIESSYDGLAVTDGNGKVLMTNKSLLKMTGCDTSSNLIKEMEDSGIVFPSSTLLALKEKRRVSFMQETPSGSKYLETCTPVLDDKGNIERVVINVRDIDALTKLRQQIEETMKLEKYHLKSGRTIDKFGFECDNIVANSIEFGRVLQIAGNVAAVDSTILLLGESGVGKDIVAKFIHKLSKRTNKPLIKIDCGAIPENLIESELFGYETGAFTGAKNRGKPGLIELADKGTLFLDEIGELPLNLQVKLLTVIQDRKLMRIGGTSEKEIDVRIIAATNRDLEKMVKKGQFRADLYYRLNVVPIEIPPLRDRRSDILPLCYHFMDIFNKKYGCSKELTKSAERVLYQYGWPGNVRELENVVERLVVTSGNNVIDDSDLPVFLLHEGGDPDTKIKVDEIIPIREASEIVEKELIQKAYEKYGTTYEMAQALGVNQSTVVRKIQKYIRNNALRHN
ncbi:MAG: sigma 54-interacting transcriptional regulator, partial [Candidatus Afipia apatlaquensis]|nr:sigma 54-interacting transcriptional regulator [Candidatus Afipia apatlaquensis]